MIVPMKKVSLAVYEKDCKNSLHKLKEAGVLHIEKKSASSDTLTKLMDRKAKVKKALAILNRYQVKKDEYPQYMPTSDKDLVSHILGLMEEKKTLQDQLIYNARERKRVEAWGDFDINSLSYLEKNGISLIPYELTRKVYDTLKTDVKLIIIDKEKLKVRAFAVGEKLAGQTPFVFTPQSLTRLDERIEYIRKRINEIETDLTNLAYRGKAIEDEDNQLPDDISYETAMAGMETWDNVSAICWVSGYVPANKIDVLKRLATQYCWALICQDPGPGDRPPTLIENNAFVRIINPVFSLIGTVPGYREIDISCSFLIFFSIFFAMLIGDAGYGVLLLSIAIIAGYLITKKAGKTPDLVKLLIVLSSCTIIWGCITGSWFAIPHEKLPVFLSALIVQPFNDSGPLEQFPLFLADLFKLPVDVPSGPLKTQWNTQFLCFTIAVIHLGFARFSCFVRQLPSLAAIAQFGWFLLMLGLYLLVLNMLLGVALPPFALYLIGIGLGINIIFAEQNGGNFFKNILKSFSNIISIFLKAISGFADIISYIRLFAVGMAGAMIAQTFNTMAIGGGLGELGLVFVLKLVGAVLILAVGHGLNLIMGALSIIVHGVRLNLLEYAGNHLGIEWSGYVYKPFASTKAN